MPDKPQCISQVPIHVIMHVTMHKYAGNIYYPTPEK